MTSLFFYGAQCTPEIWHQFNPLITSLEPVYVIYPHDILQKADSITDLAKWAKQSISTGLVLDCLIGHSMGGLIAPTECHAVR